MALTTSPSTTRFTKRQRRALAAEIEHHQQRARQMHADADALLHDEHATITRFDAEGADVDGHFVERDQLLTLAGREEEAAQAAQAALDRLDAGIYEICDGCGGRIGQARLSAMPATTLCVSCKAGTLFS
jgi:DnaK suppressor protein